MQYYAIDSNIEIDGVMTEIVNYDIEFDMYLVEYPNKERKWIEIYPQ